MGSRANYVLIEKGRVRAYYDHWGAPGSVLKLGLGAATLKEWIDTYETPADGLMDWCWAEAGFLIDYDEKRCIAFGAPDIEECAEDLPEDMAQSTREEGEAFYAGWSTYVASIADGWKGYTMVWDGRGVDAFTEHLARRKITSITTQQQSHPQNIPPPDEVFVPADALKKSASKESASKKSASKKTASKKTAKDAGND